MDNPIQERFKGNQLIFGMFYFPVYFRRPSPPFHLKVLQEANNTLNLAAQAPRGSAKSVILGFLMPVHDITYKKCHFIVIIMNTYGKAASALENIKQEFKINEKFKSHHQIKCRKDAEGDTIFEHTDGFQVRVLCKGADQIGSIRGERFGPYRPDRIIVDDLEDDIMVRNIERRQNLEREFLDVLKYVGEEGETRITIVGTILHDDSLMAKLVSKDKYKEFRKLFYKARYHINGEDISLWPEKWSIERLKKMEEDDPAGFAKEMMGDPSSGSQEAFNREDFRYWRIENNNALLFDREGNLTAKYALTDCKAAIACDLAWEEKRDSDFSVILPGFVTPNNEVLLDTYIEKRGMRPDEMEEALFSMEARLTALTGKRVAIGFEKAKLEKVMKWLLGKAMKSRNKYLWLVDLVWDGDKLLRIVTRLANRYAQHVIYHKSGMGVLENQLVRLRSTAHEDIADSAAGLVQIFDRFGPSKIAKEVKQDDEFKWWQKNATTNKPKTKLPYYIGSKKSKSAIPAKITFK